VFITLIFNLLCTGVRAQTTVAVMDFDGTAPEMTISTDVPFFDNHNTGSNDGFFGIHDANDDPTDGVPTDTGDGVTTRVNLVNASPISGDFLYVNDLRPETSDSVQFGTSDFATITFGPVDITGLSSVTFSFDYSIEDFGGTDEVTYQVFADGVGLGAVGLVNEIGNVSACIPDGRSSVSLELRIKQNGESDNAGFDNFTVLADSPGFTCADPCGITNFGPATTSCISSTAGPDNDTYEVTIPFTGADADATLVVEVDNNAAAFTIASGDLAAGTSPLIVQSAAFLEGTTFSIGLTDTGGECASLTPVSGSVTANACNPNCDVSILTQNVTFFCESLTDGIDNVTIDIDYTGNDDGVNVTITGPANGTVFSGTDLFNDPDGRVLATGIPEGDTYTVAVTGSGCDRSFVLTIPAGSCAGSDIVINEVLYDGLSSTDSTNLGSPAFSDPNRDDNFKGGEDEFVEITNTGTTTIDIGGYTLSDQNNADIITVPAGTMLAPGAYFVFFGGGAPDLPCQTAVRGGGSPFLGLNNTGNEQVIIKDASGTTVAQMSYTGMGNVNESLALSPNADPTGTYVPQTSILDPTRYSPCFDNDDMNLPVDLLLFTAYANAKAVLVNWETTSEIANDHFVVERSADGRGWMRLGVVMASEYGAGQYEFTDESPLGGVNLYRLRQVDVAGSYALYGPVTAVFTAVAGIYPNPVANEINLRGFASGTHFSLLDASGRILRELPAGTLRADVGSLRTGLYLLRASGAKGTEVIRFVKQ